MCTRLKTSSGLHLIPGQQVVYKVLGDKKLGVWGFDKGRIYNARYERLYQFWKPYSTNRGVLSVRSFYEKDHEILLSDLINLPVIYNSTDNFSILTVQAQGLLANIHYRSPIILANDPQEWLESGNIVEYIITQTA